MPPRQLMHNRAISVFLCIKVLTSCLIFCCYLLFRVASVFAAHLHPEKYYQDKWCSDHNGQSEVVLADSTRADCITDTHAIEFDFGSKWAESLGQALYYSLQTGKKAGIVLILESPKDRKYFIRLNSTIKHFDLPIDTWEMSE